MIRRTIIALLFAAITTNGQDWHTLGALWTEPGVREIVIGNAVDLNGTDEYFADAAAYSNLLNGATSMTVQAWIYTTTTNARCYLSALESADRGVSIIHAGNGVVNLYIGLGTSSRPHVSATNALQFGSWNYVCGRWVTGSASILFVNGSSYTGSVSGTGSISQRVPYWIGRHRFTVDGSYYAALLFDEIGVFRNRLLTPSEISELYNAGAGKPVNQLSTGTEGLVRLWHFDESGSNSNAYDSASGTTATGTAIGTGDWVTGKVPTP